MKKYRTKSGKVEEKLPGINATVSPSEKVQIAMAGGANTLSDVQTILGQQGKRNNLKGQGAKNIVSFQYEGMGGQDDPDEPGQSEPDTFSGVEVGDSFWGIATDPAPAPAPAPARPDPDSDPDPSGSPSGFRGAGEMSNEDLINASGATKFGSGLAVLAKTSKALQQEVSRRGTEELFGDSKLDETGKGTPTKSPLTFWTDKPLPPIKEEDTFRVIPRSIDRLKDLKEDRGYIIPETEEQREDAKPSYAEKAMDDIARNWGNPFKQVRSWAPVSPRWYNVVCGIRERAWCSWA